jgi:hypothetical protein
MALNTFQGLMRSTGGAAKESGVTPSPLTMSVVVSFVPSATAAVVRVGTSGTVGVPFVLPAGAVPISLLTIATATGAGATVDMGSAAATDGFFDEANGNTKGAITGASGSLVVGTGLTAQTPVFGISGATSATGLFTGVFTYTVYNNGVFDV